MKKIFSILIALLVLGTASFGQNKAAKTPAKKATAPAAAAKMNKPAMADKTSAVTAVKSKKDGTPDMRYKANKAAAKPAVHLKKDGTPDKRYKANKATTPKAK